VGIVDNNDVSSESRHVSDYITFRSHGRSFRLSRADVVRSLKGVDPEPVRTHGVDIGGSLYPIKQVFSIATGLDRLDFTSEVARRHLDHLGFSPVRIEGPL
jgi:hypothetical protein